jgi:hypothetical protein
MSNFELTEDDKIDTAMNLYRYLKKRTTNLSFKTIVDFFGIGNLDDEDTIETILAVFNDLVNNKNIDFRHFRRCHSNNAIVQLIHAKNMVTPSDAYKKFVENKIQLGVTPICYNGPIEILDIKSEIHCINCDIELGDRPKITCIKCKSICCSKCSHENKCFECSFDEDTENVSENINKKIMAFNISNNTNISYTEARVALANSKLTCKECSENVLLVRWRRLCCYSFHFVLNSDKKIDVVCNYCKNQHKLQFFQQLKTCTSRCHNNKNEELYTALNKELLEKSFVKPDSDANIALNFKSIE